MPSSLHTLTPLQLTRLGRFAEARPRLSELADGDRLLAEGNIYLPDEPGRAKDLFSQAARALIGDLRDEARVKEAWAYWAIGETAEAIIILDSIKARSAYIEFIWHVTRAVLERHHKASMAFLKAVELLGDDIDDPVWLGQFYCQRGYLNRRLKKPDRAIQDYQSAIMCYEGLGDQVRAARMKNNLAGVYKDTKRFEDAHEYVDEAIKTLTGTLKAQAYDQKAEIYLAQSDYLNAEQCALESVSLLETTDRKRLLADSLITMAQATAGLEKFTEASGLLDRAGEISTYLNNEDLLISVYQGRAKVATIIETICKDRAVRLALETTSNSVLLAADKLDVTREAVYQFKAKHNIK